LAVPAGEREADLVHRVLPGRKCPECGNRSLIRKDGCEFCTSCGHVGACGWPGACRRKVELIARGRVRATGAPTDERSLHYLFVERVRDYAIYLLDPQGRVTSWNAGAQRFKGYRADEVIGQHFSRFYTEEDRAAGMPEQALAIAER